MNLILSAPQAKIEQEGEVWLAAASLGSGEGVEKGQPLPVKSPGFLSLGLVSLSCRNHALPKNVRAEVAAAGRTRGSSCFLVSPLLSSLSLEDIADGDDGLGRA